MLGRSSFPEMSQRGQGDKVPTFEGRLEELQRVVDLLVHKMEDDFDLELDYHPRSIRYMDAILTEVQRSGRPLTPSLFLSIGGYVGETIVRTYGARWSELDGNLAVQLDGGSHTTTLRVFDWVKDAYADPYEKNLGQRLTSVVGDGLDAGGEARA